MQEKRQFTRIVFSTPAKLQLDGHLYDTSLVDLSLKGALITNHEHFTAQAGMPCSLFFKLDGSDITIEMLGKLSHIESEQIGLACQQMDIESVSHLKRLIELNVGSEDLLHRELEHLAHPEH